MRNEIDLEISETAGEVVMIGVAVTAAAVIISMPCSISAFAKLALKRFLDAFKSL